MGQGDPLEKEMATHSSILAWRIPWTEEPGGLQFIGLQKVGHDLAINVLCICSLHIHKIIILFVSDMNISSSSLKRLVLEV